MQTDSAAAPRFRTGLLLLAAWLLFALLAFPFVLMHNSLSEQPAPWGILLAITFYDCFLLAVSSVVVFRLARRYNFDNRRWPRSLLVHLAASVVAATLRSALLAPVLLAFNLLPERQWSLLAWFQALFTAQFPSFVLIYWLILGAALAVDFYRKYRERQVCTSQLEAQLAQAQLQVLKMQLHPHFLFNTLNAISALMHRDVELADRMIARLGDLLRSTLENAGTQEVSLQEELDFIRPYLEIEQARLGERLTVALDVDPNTLSARVPNLLLQPLVENAIRHGIAPRAEPGRIEIRARRDHGALQVQVRDDGPGLTAPDMKKGIGVANTRARLQQLYGSTQRFDMTNGPGQGLTVTITFPYREHAEGPLDASHSHADRR